MSELRLKLSDPTGVVVAVDRPRFVIGRHSGCDLTIADSRLSREHLVIEVEGDHYFASDLGSSNGSELNGEPLDDRVELSNGDQLSLGGFEIAIEIEVTAAEPANDSAVELFASNSPATTASPAPKPESTGIPTTVLIIAPILVLFVIGVLGVLIWSGSNRTSSNQNQIGSFENDDVPTPRPSRTPSSSPAGPNISNNGNEPPPSEPSNSVVTPQNELTAKVEQNAAKFLRNAAANDPGAFITGAQADIVAGKAKSLASSSGVADSIRSANRSSTAIKELAASKSLKPQFLAAAAIAKRGAGGGDVLASARAIAANMDKFRTHIGNELGEDCLLMIAVLDHEDPMKMRNMLQDLATKSKESPRTIRTIWWLKKNSKITDAEYQAAITFLAIGTIAQNPRDFGVNIEGWNF